MKSNNNTSHQDQRLSLFEDTDVLRRVDAAEAKRLSPKAKDCQRQLNEASSAWAVDGKKFLFVFAKKTDGDQKVTVWGVKKPGEYQRIKTVLVVNDDDIFEAVPTFLNEYFELPFNPDSYHIDVDWLYDIEDELKFRSNNCPASLKPKLKLLRIWSEFMPRFNHMVADLDFKVLRSTEPDMADIVAPHETSDPVEMLKTMQKLNPDAFPDLIRNLAKSIDEFDWDEDAHKVDKEVPDFIDSVAEEWRSTIIDDKTPMGLTEAYIRFDRAWNSYCACVLGNMFGDICDEYWHRTDQLGFLIDRKIHATKDLDERVHLMNLFRLLIPQYIDMNEEESNIDYEKSWNKPLAARIVESGTLTPERIELLIRVREDFKRLPVPISKYIKTDLPEFLNRQVDKINPDYLKDPESLKTAIQMLDNYIQWYLITENKSHDMEKKTDACFDLIAKEMEKVDDIRTWLLYCNLMMTGFAPIGTVKDRSRFQSRVEQRLKKAVTIRKSRSSEDKNDTSDFAERLLLASMYLENLFLEDKGCDIYTSYWALKEQDKMQEEIWKAKGRLFF